MERLTVWRLEKRRYADVAFRGYGSLKTGGRWHRKGTQVAYASEHPAVSAMEKMVWLESYERAQASEYVLLTLRLDPERHVESIPLERLPDGWDAYPHDPATQEIGTRWFREERSVVLEVPSAVIPVAKNYLINPFHPHFHELERGDPTLFAWDARLFSRRGSSTGGRGA